MRAHQYRLPVAILAAAAAAGGATLLLRPRSGVIEPAAASATDYFTTAELQKAHDFRAPQRALALGSLTLSGAVIGRFPERWWLPGAAAAVGLSTLIVFAAPVVIDPLFNKFEPLPEGPLRSQVLELAHQAGVEVGEVYRVDASRRTTGHNAYVW